ncbi:MAG TPA: hypothetical protein EYP05_09050, partial [Piscirickettsiaceae bacterium]|nr:hypothetical protein [Piscirickettsiaceae bacterium]
FPLRDIPDRRRDEEIAERILDVHVETATKKYSILKPLEIDGIGSMLGLYRLLKKKGKSVECAMKDAVPHTPPML